MPSSKPSLSLLASGILLAGIAGSAPQQGPPPSEVLFSMDSQGPSISQQPTPGGPLVTEADLLRIVGPTFFTPLAPVAGPGSFLNFYTQCVGHAPGFSCGIEVDASSFGRDALLQASPGYTYDMYFSVDEFATGLAGGGPRSVTGEAAFFEAAADIYVTGIDTPGPVFGFGENVLVQDGNGEGSTTQGPAIAPGVGLKEPIIPSPQVPESGDNLDSLEIRTMGAPNFPYFFSLEAGFSDPNQPNVPVANSAANQTDPNGLPFRGADVIVLTGQGQTLLYASADVLGLDTVGGANSDDIDALVLRENGVPGYQRSQAPFDWLGGQGPASDLLLYSVRRGSAVIGQPDSRFGIPISEGDMLGPPLPGTSTPAIYINAEQVGLEPGDDIVACDLRDGEQRPINDCNDNGVEDALDIANGASDDKDGNGVPDECEEVGTPDCDCDDTAESSCGNTAGPDEGCLNNTGQGGRLRAIGTSSLLTDSLELQVSQVTPNTFGIVVLADGIFSGINPPGNNGRLCLSPGTNGIFRIGIEPTGAGGAFTTGPGLFQDAGSLSNPVFVTVGETWGFQVWYRDLGGPCGGGLSNLTNAWVLTLTP